VVESIFVTMPLSVAKYLYLYANFKMFNFETGSFLKN
jgi:hypothetical protein